MVLNTKMDNKNSRNNSADTDTDADAEANADGSDSDIDSLNGSLSLMNLPALNNNMQRQAKFASNGRLQSSQLPPQLSSCSTIGDNSLPSLANFESTQNCFEFSTSVFAASNRGLTNNLSNTNGIEEHDEASASLASMDYDESKNENFEDFMPSLLSRYHQQHQQQFIMQPNERNNIMMQQNSTTSCSIAMNSTTTNDNSINTGNDTDLYNSSWVSNDISIFSEQSLTIADIQNSEQMQTIGSNNNSQISDNNNCNNNHNNSNGNNNRNNARKSNNNDDDRSNIRVKNNHNSANDVSTNPDIFHNSTKSSVSASTVPTPRRNSKTANAISQLGKYDMAIYDDYEGEMDESELYFKVLYSNHGNAINTNTNNTKSGIKGNNFSSYLGGTGGNKDIRSMASINSRLNTGTKDKSASISMLDKDLEALEQEQEQQQEQQQTQRKITAPQQPNNRSLSTSRTGVGAVAVMKSPVKSKKIIRNSNNGAMMSPTKGTRTISQTLKSPKTPGGRQLSRGRQLSGGRQTSGARQTPKTPGRRSLSNPKKERRDTNRSGSASRASPKRRSKSRENKTNANSKTSGNSRSNSNCRPSRQGSNSYQIAIVSDGMKGGLMSSDHDHNLKERGRSRGAAARRQQHQQHQHHQHHQHRDQMRRNRSCGAPTNRRSNSVSAPAKSDLRRTQSCDTRRNLQDKCRRRNSSITTKARDYRVESERMKRERVRSSNDLTNTATDGHENDADCRNCSKSRSGSVTSGISRSRSRSKSQSRKLIERQLQDDQKEQELQIEQQRRSKSLQRSPRKSPKNTIGGIAPPPSPRKMPKPQHRRGRSLTSRPVQHGVSGSSPSVANNSKSPRGSSKGSIQRTQRPKARSTTPTKAGAFNSHPEANTMKSPRLQKQQIMQRNEQRLNASDGNHNNSSGNLAVHHHRRMRAKSQGASTSPTKAPGKPQSKLCDNNKFQLQNNLFDETTINTATVTNNTRGSRRKWNSFTMTGGGSCNGSNSNIAAALVYCFNGSNKLDDSSNGNKDNDDDSHSASSHTFSFAADDLSNGEVLGGKSKSQAIVKMNMDNNSKSSTLLQLLALNNPDPNNSSSNDLLSNPNNDSGFCTVETPNTEDSAVPPSTPIAVRSSSLTSCPQSCPTSAILSRRGRSSDINRDILLRMLPPRVDSDSDLNGSNHHMSRVDFLSEENMPVWLKRQLNSRKSVLNIEGQQ